MTNPLKIYSGANTLLYTTPINIGCRRRVQLMNEDSITVKFSDKTKMKFPVGTRIGDFYITKEQQEKYNAATGGYDYELKFDAYYWLWANKLLFYVMPGVANAPKETSFKLTATIDVHAAVILRCLNALGITYYNSPFRVDTDAGFSTEAKYISYANMSVLGGIQAIADAYECEWWVVGNAIHFGRCNDTGVFDFTVGENVASITSDSKETAPNRLIVFGSTRNLPPDYRTPELSDVVDAVVVKRLMLPAGNPYLQTSPDIPEDEIVEKEVVLDSIYPRTALTVSDVVTYDSTSEGVTQTFYRLKYGVSFPFSKDYILPDEELHIVFESGDLNGMDFAVKFNPLGLAEKKDNGSWNPDAQMFEIVVNEDYGRPLPDVVLHPAVGDKFSLYGWNATQMEALGLVADAEQELLTEGNKLLAEYTKDTHTYTCPMMWDWCKAKMEANSAPRLGDAVTLHFVAGDAGRLSRIIGFEHDLDIEYSNVTYICGEKVSVSRLKTLESKVEGLTHDGTKVKIQNSLDFLSKRYSDTTPYSLGVEGILRALGGAEFGKYLSGAFGAAIDARGNADVESIKVRSFMQVAELIVNRLSAIEGDVVLTESDTFESVDRLDPDEAGNQRFRCKCREQWDGYFTAQYRNNVLRGIYNDITRQIDPNKNGVTEIHNALYYTSWMRVESVGGPENNNDANTLTVVMYPDGEVPAQQNFPPCELMRVARWGNAGGTESEMMRQTCLYLSSTEGRIMKYINVTKPIIDKGNVAFCLGTMPEFLAAQDGTLRAGDEAVYVQKLLAAEFREVDYFGRPKPEIRDRGEWSAAVAAAKFTDEDGTEHPDGYFNGDTRRISTMEYERSVVGRVGCRWICCVDGTDKPPLSGGLDWALYSGDPRLRLEWAGSEDSVWADNPQLTLQVLASLGSQDLTSDSRINWKWTRRSWQDDVEQTTSDVKWNSHHTAGTNTLSLGMSDMNYSFGNPPTRLEFTVTATLTDGSGQPMKIPVDNGSGKAVMPETAEPLSATMTFEI